LKKLYAASVKYILYRIYTNQIQFVSKYNTVSTSMEIFGGQTFGQTGRQTEKLISGQQMTDTWVYKQFNEFCCEENLVCPENDVQPTY
jgi:hypothetical protein